MRKNYGDGNLKGYSTFTYWYAKKNMVYCRYDNSKCNRFKETTFFSGLFIPYPQLTQSFPQPFIQNPQVSQKSIQFNSDFECGNLFAAFQTSKTSYDLIMTNDTNSKGSTQWFYFSIAGMQANREYNFRIVNFTKKDSLFNYGMRPVGYSMRQNRNVDPNNYPYEIEYNRNNGQTPGWLKVGKNVSYSRGKIERQNNKGYYYVLSFTVIAKFGNDKIFFAHSYPYSYNRIQKIMKEKCFIGQEKNQKDIFDVDVIEYGKSVGGRDLCAYLVTTPKNKQKQEKLKQNKCEQAIVIMARQHPGEPQGSFVFEGFLSHITKPQNSFLLSYKIYLIPMVNPDGVVQGNYRTNLHGKDLNRKWDQSCSQDQTPEVYALKQFLSKIKQNNEIRFVLDLHGHSKKLNSFFYGNPCNENPQLVKMFPYICSRYSQAIQYLDCTFNIDKNKKKSARVFLSTFLKQINVYTFESSFYAFRNRNDNTVEFTPKQYMMLGAILATSLQCLLCQQKQIKTNLPISQVPSNSKQSFSEPQLQILSQNKFLNSVQIYKIFQKQLKLNMSLLKTGQQDTSGSESQPEQFEIFTQPITTGTITTNTTQNGYQTSKFQTNHSLSQVQAQQIASKSKSVRISSRKTYQQNTMDYKEVLNLQSRNKKLFSISQVNAVLPDKYNISLLPISKFPLQTNNKKSQAETQTKNNPIFGLKLEQQQIEKTQNLAGKILQRKKSSICKGQLTRKHSQIIAQIQRNSHHQPLRQPRPKPSMSAHIPIKLQCKTSVFTQTILSIPSQLPLSKSPTLNDQYQKNNKITSTPIQSPIQCLPISFNDKNSRDGYRNQNGKQKQENKKNDVMEQINLQVKRIYNRKNVVSEFKNKNRSISIKQKEPIQKLSILNSIHTKPKK